MKAESSGLCQSCTAEGVCVSVAEEKKNIYRFSNSTDTVFAQIVLHSLPNENRRNVNLPQNNTIATGLLQNNAYGHELVLFCLIIPCVFTVCQCFIFAKSVSGYSGFASTDMGQCDRSRNQSSDCNRSMNTH